MLARTRMSTFLSRFIAPASLTACVLVPPELDDVACLTVPYGDDCPSAADAEAELIGDQTCESPVREVIASGEFLYSEDKICTLRGVIVCEGSSAITTGNAADADTDCCYEAAYKVHPNESCVVGRPLVVDGHPISARAMVRSDWARADRPDPSDLSAADRAALAQIWAQAALLEHASIAAFARLSLDLLALGAPPHLLARTAQAMQDEVGHAEACFALAAAYGGQPVGPGPLPVARGAEVDLVRLAVETFREGCVGESFAVGMAAAQLTGAEDPAVQAALQRIVIDEQRHAELAWDIVRWAIALGGEEVRRAVQAEISELTVPAVPVSAGPSAHGIAQPEVLARALHGMLADVIRPTALDLVA